VSAGNRIAALAALVLALVALTLVAVTTVETFPGGLILLACLALALAAAWYGAVRHGIGRAIGLIVAAGLLVGAVWVLVVGRPLAAVAAIAALWLALAAARTAFRVRVHWRRAPPPEHAVLFFNPLSGGGKAARFHLADEARRRGIEPIELTRGTDLETLVRDAIAAGADGLAMAGGDGSQAVVAALAAEHGLPYACIPAGTRNNFALDLGVIRDDVVGALDAFVDGGERIVDLADVNGRVFVNNVSLGLYAEAVERPGYREAKLRTLLDAMPDTLGPKAGNGLDLHWNGPDGHEHVVGAAILVSNNSYRLGRALGSGTRPRIDAGRLGITVVGATGGHRLWQEWTAPDFEVTSGGDVAAGVDGETMRLPSPLRFSIHPHALRVRIARDHPGVSPSAVQPSGPWHGIRALAGIVAGRTPAPPAQS